MSRKRIMITAISLLGVTIGLVAWSVSTRAKSNKPGLPEAASDIVKKFGILTDFDGDACYPAPAIYADGTVNGGLKATGAIAGGCRHVEQLTQANTYCRQATIKSNDGIEYTVIMYALYFEKDQFMPGAGGHRHDWEFGLVWLRNGELTHASCSAHGKVDTKAKGELQFDPGKENNVKIVYHKDDIKTHAFRFAKDDEKGDASAENDLKRWITPALVEWQRTDAAVRNTLNSHDFGEANCPVNDKNFAGEIAKNPPQGYPGADEWRAAAGAR
jgi:hypothetical protein